MTTLTYQSHPEKINTRIQSLLVRVLHQTDARYLLLVHDLAGDFGFSSACFTSKEKIYEPGFSDYLKHFVEEEVKENVSYRLSAGIIEERLPGLSLFSYDLKAFEFLPVCSEVNRLGVLVLGYEELFPADQYSGDAMRELAEALSCEKQKLVVSKEKIYQLNKALITVQEPKPLGDILKHQINPLLNLYTSAIICAKDGKAANEYQFYFNPNELPGGCVHGLTAGLPHTIGADSYTYLYNQLRRSKDAEAYFDVHFDKYAEKDELHPFFSAFQNDGYRRATVVNLLRGTETVGFWVLIFKKDFDVSDLPDGILDATAVQLATTVHSINSFSQLIDAKKESEVLQSLNIDLAATRDERNLLKLIRTRLQNLFQFSHHFIYKINDDQMTVSPMLVDSQSRTQYHPSFPLVMNMNVNIADGIFNKALISSEPVIFDLTRLNERGQLPVYLQINYESGMKKVVMLALRVNSKVMGIWCIAFTGEQLILPRYLELIKTAAAPISIAVANIRINESLRERQAERDKLMDLSFDLTTVRSKAEFMQTIEPYLRKLFAFNNLSIFVDQDDYESRPFIYLSSGGISKNAVAFELEDPAQFKGARVYSRLFQSPDVSVVDADRLMEKAGRTAFLGTEHEEGMSTAVIIALRNDNRRIGVLSLYLQEGVQYSEQQLHLFKEVSYQIAKAVSNILYNEEIARRDREKELLLALSEDIAAVREKDQLIRVIDERLKPILKFTHISLSMKCSDDFVVSFLTDPDSASRGHRDYGQLQRQDIRQCADFINFVDTSPVPVIVSPQQDHEFKDLPKFLSVNFESGIEEILIARLFDGVSVFGYWALCFSCAGTVRANQFGFLQGIANQFSTAIYNISANLEIAGRQKENKLLIDLGNYTAGLRNYSQLMKLVSTELRDVFNFESCFIGVMEEGSPSFKVLLPERETGKFHHLETSMPDMLPGDLLQILMESDQPLIIKRTGEYEVFWNTVRAESDFEKAVITKFMHDGSLLAFWVMFFPDERGIDQSQFRMLKGINDQLSIAVANITIYERLANDERKKGMMLALSTKISSARNPTELLKMLAADLKTVLKFSHGSIVLFNNKEKTFALPWVLPSESKSSGHPRYTDITSLTPVYDGVADLALGSEKPLIVDIAAFPDQEKMPLYMQVSFECGMTHVVFVKLVINNEILGFWVLWYDIKPEGTNAYLESVEQIANVLAVPIFNISFNEQINRREQEKTNLLDFIDAIAGVKDKFELRKIFSHYLRNLCLIEDLCLHWLTEDKKSQYCYFWDDEGEYTGDDDFESIISSVYTTDDLVFRKLLAAEAAVKFSAQEMANDPEVPVYLKFLSSAASPDFIGVPLFKSREIVGVLFVRAYDSNTADQPLFKGLCAQLAIAVSDLIAAEMITRQLSEINSYKERLEEEKIYLKEELETSNYSEVVGSSPEIREVFQKVSQVASSESTVLILGETGTGKELIARAIHNNSPRSNKLMVKVNCAALPASLIESELFGHERGSFTGATEKRIGKFELASGGTLFLDEIGELPLELQVKFLRALQEREIERIGGKTTIKVDVRIIAATNRNLEQEIAEGRFRSDLYFRLSTFPILLPSLRDRRDDIPLLASHFVNRFAKKTGKAINMISQRAMQELLAYSWPGNVRELEHQLERSVLLTKGSTIKSIELPAGRPLSPAAATAEEPEPAQTIDDHERSLILRTLKQCHGKVSGAKGAAALLGVPSSTLNSKMKRLGIKKNFLR